MVLLKVLRLTGFPKYSQYGFQNTLVNLGEFAARGVKQSEPWRLGIRDTLSGQIVTIVECGNSTIATSEPHGTLIAGHSHLFDPLEQVGERWVSVTVEADEAWRADAQMVLRWQWDFLYWESQQQSRTAPISPYT